MTTISIAAACLLAAAIAGCTGEQMYASMQEAARDQCQRMPDADRAACLKRNSSDYDTYQKQRAEVRK